MRRWSEARGKQRVELDACPSCALIWFDFGELGKVKGFQPGTPRKARAPAKGRGASGSDVAEEAGESLGEGALEALFEVVGGWFD